MWGNMDHWKACSLVVTLGANITQYFGTVLHTFLSFQQQQQQEQQKKSKICVLLF